MTILWMVMGLENNMGMDRIRTLCREHREILLYVVFGGLTTGVNYVIYFLCRQLFAVEYVAANVLAWIGAVTFAYLTNRRFVFQSRASGTTAVFLEAVRFYLARVITLLMESGLLVLAVEGFHLSDTLPKIGAGILVIIANYVLSKWLVFRRKS